MTNLEQRIFDYIECKYKAKFLGDLHVHKDENDGSYTLFLITSNYMAPLCITHQVTSEEDFYNKVTQDLGTRDLVRVGYFKLNLDGKIENRK